MSERMKTLAVLQEQIYPPLECTASSTCWCMKLSHQFPMQHGECMSPSELLNAAGSELPQRDIEFLTSLLGRKFIP